VRLLHRYGLVEGFEEREREGKGAVAVLFRRRKQEPETP